MGIEEITRKQGWFVQGRAWGPKVDTYTPSTKYHMVSASNALFNIIYIIRIYQDDNCRKVALSRAFRATPVSIWVNTSIKLAIMTFKTISVSTRFADLLTIKQGEQIAWE